MELREGLSITSAAGPREHLARSIAELEKLAGSAISPPVASPQRARHGAPYRLAAAAALVAIAVLFAALLTVRPRRNGGRTLCNGDLDAFMLERLGERDCDPRLRVDATALPGGPNAVAPAALVDVTRRSYEVPGERLRGIEIPRVPPNGLVDLRTRAYWGVVSVHLAHHGERLRGRRRARPGSSLRGPRPLSRRRRSRHADRCGRIRVTHVQGAAPRWPRGVGVRSARYDDADRRRDVQSRHGP